MCWRQATTTMCISAWRRPTDWLVGHSVTESSQPSPPYTLQWPTLNRSSVWTWTDMTHPPSLSLSLSLSTDYYYYFFFFVSHPSTPGNLPANPRLRTSALRISERFRFTALCEYWRIWCPTLCNTLASCFKGGICYCCEGNHLKISQNVGLALTEVAGRRSLRRLTLFGRV